MLTQMVDALGNPTDFTYDARRRLIETEYADPDGAGSLGRPSVTRTLDGAGNETGRLEPFAAVSQTMVYDAYGHLTTKTWSSGTLGTRSEYWSYDVLGNLTSHTNYLNQTDTYAYDARSRLVTATGHSPGGGGSAPVTTYTYNAASQPLTVTNPMGALTQYVYASSSGWLEKIIWA